MCSTDIKGHVKGSLKDHFKPRNILSPAHRIRDAIHHDFDYISGNVDIDRQNAQQDAEYQARFTKSDNKKRAKATILTENKNDNGLLTILGQK